MRIDPYNDPIYGGGAGDGYKAIGLSRAWAFIRGSGVELNNVKVGVVDDGLYIPGEGAENEFEGGKTKIEFPDPAAGELATPEVRSDGQTNAAGSHGTGVSTVIGADPDNGGPSGVAGPLGDKLTISMINHYAGQYGTVEAPPDPNDPTKFVWTNGKTYVDGSLVALNKQIENGATVINCSWGNSQADPATVAAYTRYFTKMAEEHPDVLFVCSGGNGGQVMNGAARIPSGLPLPNMITVGASENDQIHFFYHFQEKRNGGSTEQALRHTLLIAGRAIVFATLINAGGFLALALSGLPPMRQFGIISASAFVLSMVASFTALPASLWIFFREVPDGAAGARGRPGSRRAGGRNGRE